MAEHKILDLFSKLRSSFIENKKMQGLSGSIFHVASCVEIGPSLGHFVDGSDVLGSDQTQVLGLFIQF